MFPAEAPFDLAEPEELAVGGFEAGLAADLDASLAALDFCDAPRAADAAGFFLATAMGSSRATNG